MEQYTPASKEIEADELKERCARTEWLERLFSVANSPDGIVVFAELFSRCGWNNSTFKNNSTSFFAEGRKSVSEELAKELLEVSPELFLKIVTYKSEMSKR